MVSDADFKGRHVVSIKDFSNEEIMHVLDTADKLMPFARKGNKMLDGKIIATLFYEPSTRTRFSFECAMERLGGNILSFSEPKSTSVAKGETLADTIRTIACYSDVIVLRHPQEGAARLAAQFSSVPILNAGDGAGQHPTQTLLDLFTIRKHKKDIKGKTVALVGDLKYGRTTHSLAYALSRLGANLMFISPPTLQMPKEVLGEVRKNGIEPKVTSNLEEAVKEADVLYVTRIQKERFPDPEEYAKVAGIYRVDKALLEKAKPGMIVMHPLPRVDEISADVDSLPSAIYFEQAFNGVAVRMALLKLILG
jgi:aspartate carbamoyltransferase catalytic subunit